MGSRYSVRIVVLESGERLPLLVDCETGIPLFEPTIYALTELRARSRASATIEQALRAVLVLYKFLDARSISLDARLDKGRLLQLGEIDDLARHCRLPLENHFDESDSAPSRRPTIPKPQSLEKARMCAGLTHRAEIDASSAAVRLRYIRDYMRWLATDRLLKLERSHQNRAALLSESEIVIRALSERIPSGANRDFVGRRQGLSPEALARLDEIINLACVDNPWRGTHARERNALMVHWLKSLGLRRGELLGVRIANIDFQANEVRITRRADDPTDPRPRQPNTKTHGRLLPLDDDLAQLTRHYVMHVRGRIAGARKHDFLFVANGSGAPLTLAAVDRIFASLREKCPDLLQDLTPHVLRHSWNDHFSELMDRNRVSEETEQKMRARLMGWSETSKTAAIYTRRHIQRRAREASLNLQKKLAATKPK